MVYTFTKKTKRIAKLLLIIWLINISLPLATYALTSGPSQPESQSFQPAGVSDMVDLFSGDFKYNIPLLDVDGYPLNLNYQSGVGMDDEASWVGLGWNLNVGSINRQLRGIPDDFAGDEIKTEHFTKPKVTVGGRLTAKVEVGGKAKLGGSFNFGIFSDNYTGIGAELGVNAGMSFSLANDGLLTAGLGIGVLSNTASGVDISPNVSLSILENAKQKNIINAGLSSSLGYNSRSGLKTLTLGRSVMSYNSSFLNVSYNTEPIMPKIQVPYHTDYSSFSIDVGGVAAVVFAGGGGTGYKSVRKVASEQMSNPGYGFLYAELGKNKKNAVMDFIREKENPVIPELPNLALPIHTPDIFTYNSQSGSGQFRLFRGGTGILFDNESVDRSNVETVGADAGIGAYFHGGVTNFNQNTTNSTRKWTNENKYLTKGDFQDEPGTNLNKQHVFFKKMGDRNMEDAEMASKLINNSLLSISTSKKTANSSFISQTDIGSNVTSINDSIQKESRQVQSTVISYLTANEAAQAGLDKQINTYAFNEFGNFQPSPNNSLIIADSVSRKDNPIKKKQHISEITVNTTDGQRTVYGLPVYNLKQEEYSFAVGSGYESKDGLVAIADNGIERNKGIDHYYHKDSQSPYAYSYLLTGLLSPDYQDKTGNGITEDDNGTAIKFNYSKINNYKWRTPYKNKLNGTNLRNTAALNKGLLADPDDDKASIIYGEKEIYYVHTIESKTKIAYFITENRLDGLGVQNLNGSPDESVRQKCLREIRLYSKANLSKPIKVVKFEYSYELCPGSPNSIAGPAEGAAIGQGKLTLKKVWFEYGLTHKGENHPYVFSYNNTLNNAVVTYASMQADRWGSYKAPVNNQGNLTNEEYPYANQNKSEADLSAGLWHIKSIELPSGGKIEVDYESDDYAYVQNKQAMEMVPFQMMGTSGSLAGTPGIKIPINETPPSNISETEWFKKTYLNGSDYIYTKSYVKLSTPNAPSEGRDYDFVPAYCKISNVKIVNGIAEIKFEPVNEANVSVNPIRSAAWQRLKNEYPRYAYPGFQNRVKDSGGSIGALVSAIANAVNNLSELKENFYQKANRRGFAKEINESRSFAKITKTSGFKLGGGARVKKITITDNWDELTGGNVVKGTYGQSYDYTTISNGKKISSGVATYEPSVGNDENPLKQPIPYIQKIKGAINNFFELEEPFGESFFPAPSVGYSKVTVRDLEANGTETEFPKTGFIVNEFYTAKDFPVRVKVSPMQRYNPKPSNQYSLVKTQSIEELVLSQGYSIELNDMHGKEKANRIFNQSGSEVSSTSYLYQVENPNEAELKLDNKVNVVNQNGYISTNTIGRDIEFFTDFREQESVNSGKAVNIGVDVVPALFIPIPIPHWPVNDNNEYKLFRSACAVKVIQTSGILNKVIKKENGSSIAVENVAYDGVTGEALITKTQNEFNRNYYSVNLPAYWAFRKMGGAYQNIGMLLQNVTLNANFEINSNYRNLLTQGDELVNLGTGIHYWVVDYKDVPVYLGGELQWSEPTKLLIDVNGSRLSSITGGALNHTFKVVRSGFRNVLDASAQNVICVNNPIQNGKLAIASPSDLSVLKVINASSVVYSDEWPVDGTGQVTGDRIENTSQTFTYRLSQPHSFHGSAGTRFYQPCNESLIGTEEWGWSSENCDAYSYFSTNSYLNNRQNQAGIWPDLPAPGIEEPLGFTAKFYAPVSKYYCIGFAGDDRLNIKIDGMNVISNTYNNANYWTIYPIWLSEGNHTIEVEGFNQRNDYTDWDRNPGSMAVEIYDNNYNQIRNAVESYGITTIFSTRNLLFYPSSFQTFRTINGVKTWRFTYETYFNPFVQGMKGNWRPYAQNVYQENRVYDNIFTPGKKGVNVVNSGYLSSFMSYWVYQSSGDWGVNPTTKWVNTNTIKQYDKYGQEVENQDALKRYSAASFDFAGQLPSAVVSNAMRREIFSNSFEDVSRMNTIPDTNATKEFTLINGQPIVANIYDYTNRVASESHSGNYSVKLPSSGIQLLTRKHSTEQKDVTKPYLGKTSKNEFTLLNTEGLYPRGFEPKPNNTYLISFWIKDKQPSNKDVNVKVSVGNVNSPVQISLNCKAVLEGWKQIEGVFEIPYNPNDNSFNVSILPGFSGIYIDDIRIHPKDAHMKTYVYDDKNFKLMAELDENTFATFYEYDDEGSLVRVKKETERGIMTIKENRSSYRKK